MRSRISAAAPAMHDDPRQPDDPAALWRMWRSAAIEPAVDQAIRDLYASLDAAVAAYGPTCWVSGRCCKFDQFGHRLYVTGLEIAWFLQHLTPPRKTAPEPTARGVIRLPIHAQTPGACPYQIDGLCSTHAIRPLGCRIFFCQHGTDAWQHDLYERYLADLRALHERHALPYRYMDWIAGLAEADGVQDHGRVA